jgi:hypothetical protein
LTNLPKGKHRAGQSRRNGRFPLANPLLWCYHLAMMPNEAVVEVQVSALLSGHDLTPFVLLPDTTDEYQATCRRCGRTVSVRRSTLLYSLLGYANCPGSATTDRAP